jgi:hypothetical protein
VKTRNRVVRTSLERQELRKEWLVLGVVVWSKTLATEDVPTFAWIANACLGSSDWTSKFAPFDETGVLLAPKPAPPGRNKA